MTKINIRLPEPKEEYDVSNQKQINRALTIMKDQLNSTFLDEVKQEQERVSWFMGGNVFTNAKKDLTTNSETVVYTVPASTTGIIKSILVSEDSGNADTITLTLTDASSNVFSLFKTKTVSANATTELLEQPIVLQESEVIKATAATGNRLHIVLSVLQINRE